MSFIIDTDIGTDVDDAFALAYALKNNADIKAISTVIGNTWIRERIARKLEKLVTQKNSIPIIAGERGSEKVREKYWTGIEDKALTKKEKKELLKYNPFPVYTKDDILVCIAPLLNIAYQINNLDNLSNPSIKNIQRVYIMGSKSRDHNLTVDKNATKIVLQQNWIRHHIRKEDSKKIYFTRKELKQFRGSELGNFLYDSAIRWSDYARKQDLPMYDVLAVSAAMGENFVKFKGNGRKFVSYDVDLKLKDRILETIRSVK